MSAGGRGHREFDQLPLAVLQGVDHQELLGMHRMVQGEPWELQVDSHVQPSAGSQANAPALQKPCFVTLWAHPVDSDRCLEGSNLMQMRTARRGRHNVAPPPVQGRTRPVPFAAGSMSSALPSC